MERIAALGALQEERLARFRGDPRFENVRRLGTIAALELKVPDPGYLAGIGRELTAFFLGAASCCAPWATPSMSCRLIASRRGNSIWSMMPLRRRPGNLRNRRVIPCELTGVEASEAADEHQAALSGDGRRRAGGVRAPLAWPRFGRRSGQGNSGAPPSIRPIRRPAKSRCWRAAASGASRACSNMSKASPRLWPVMRAARKDTARYGSGQHRHHRPCRIGADHFRSASGDIRSDCCGSISRWRMIPPS